VKTLLTAVLRRLATVPPRRWLGREAEPRCTGNLKGCQDCCKLEACTTAFGGSFHGFATAHQCHEPDATMADATAHLIVVPTCRSWKAPCSFLTCSPPMNLKIASAWKSTRRSSGSWEVSRCSPCCRASSRQNHSPAWSAGEVCPSGRMPEARYALKAPNNARISSSTCAASASVWAISSRSNCR
jgi:hypothetical protein